MQIDMAERVRPSISIGEDGIDDLRYLDDGGSFQGDTESLLSNEEGVFSGGESVNLDKHKPTTDWMHLAYIILYLQGVGSLLPWNFFITARGYFMDKFNYEPHIADSFESAFSVAAMVPNVLALLVNVFLTKHMNRTLRAVTCIIVTLLCFVVTTVFVKIDTSTWTKSFFAITIVTVVLINIASAIYGGTFFGVAGIIGEKYTQAMMGGQGLGGTFAAVASILSLAGNSSPENSAFGYFLIAVVVICLCIVGYFVFFRLSYVNFVLKRNELTSFRGSQSSTFLDKPAIKALTASSNSLVSATSVGSLNSMSSLAFPAQEKVPYFQIFKGLYPMALSVSFTFFITLALFPSIISGIKSMNEGNGSKWTNTFFAPLMCFLLFNLGDLAGRTVAGFVQCFSHDSCWIPFLCLSRVIFIPLFALCNYNLHHRHAPVVFNHDAYPVVFVVLFALSNGYLGSLCMMFGPKRVDGKYAEIAGTIMALFLSSGLAMGAGFSFALVSLI